MMGCINCGRPTKEVMGRVVVWIECAGCGFSEDYCVCKPVELEAAA